MNVKLQIRHFAVPALLIFISACGSIPTNRDGPPSNPPPDVRNVPDAVPRDEPLSKYGNPESYEVNGKRYAVLKERKGYIARGVASWYGRKFHGRRTSSGETYDMYAMTAAHKSLPLPTYARVTNLDNGKTVTVKINDRGPFHDDRILDLSYAAASKLGILSTGTGRVEVVAIEPRPAGEIVADTIYVQVGAFAEKNNAEKLLDRLKQAAITSGIQTTSVSDAYAQLFRVRVGPFQEMLDAQRMARNLLEMGLNEAKIITE